MSDRLLKESDVIRAIDKRVEELRNDPEFVRKKGYIDVLGIKKYILTIPSADRPQEWIPCSERLPEESGMYFCTCNDGYDNRTTFVKYQKRFSKWDLTGTRSYWGVIAWMPLPEPYDGSKNENNSNSHSGSHM